jgi:hypothetical protein
MPEERATVVDRWRGRADELEEYARWMRAAGDPVEACDAEAAAAEYRAAAEDAEWGR